MQKPQLVFCHGWGYDEHYWDVLEKHFQDHAILKWNLGYFGTYSCPLPEKKPCIAIGHSLGLVKLATSGARWDALIGIQSFYNFLGNSPSVRERRLPRHTRMREHYLSDSVGSMRAAYERCGVPYMSQHAEDLDGERMLADLDSLKHAYAFPVVPTLIVGSRDDPIVPLSLLKDNFDGMNMVELKILAHGQHGLGVLEAQSVADEIKRFLALHLG